MVNSEEIRALYKYEVGSYYAERILDFAADKQQCFQWLFGERNRIEISLPDEEAVAFFYETDLEFRQLFTQTVEFIKKSDAVEEEKQQNIKLAIFRNQIHYQKNRYKFSKFYKRFLITETKPVDMQKLYDRLKTAKCILSIHPVDFLSASEKSSYSSCYAIDSCHHTGCSAYLRDNFTIIAYTTMNNKKIGRQWIYLSNGFIVFGRVYGAISEPLENAMRLFLEEKYANHLKIPNEWILSKSRTMNEDQLYNCGHCENNHEEYAVYFDMDTHSMIRSKTITDNFSDLYLEFENGIDRDGDDTENGSFGCRICACCEGTIYGESYETDDGEVCEHCLNNRYLYCSLCDTYYHEDGGHVHYIEDEDKYVCENCYNEEDYFYCEKTSSYYSKEAGVNLILENGSEAFVHKDWAEVNAFYCEHCDEYHDNPLTEVEGADYCDNCLEEYFNVVDEKYIIKEQNAA
jgi:hypothetical protein